MATSILNSTVDEILQQDSKYRYAGILDPEDLHVLSSLKSSSSLNYDCATLVDRRIADDAASGTSKKLVRSVKDFTKKFYENYPELEGINFTNLLVAGGAVGESILPSCGRLSSDVDFFIYGLDQTQAVVRVREWLKDVLQNIAAATNQKKHYYGDIEIVRNNNTLTVKVDNERIYQVIFRLYTSKSEILHGFDLGSSAIGFDGSEVYFTSLGRYSYERSCNIVDVTRRSTTYESRLKKYFKRGFAIVMPKFNIHKLKTDYLIYNKVEICVMPNLVFSYYAIEGNKIVIDEFYDAKTHKTETEMSDYEGEIRNLQAFTHNLYNLIHTIDFFYWTSTLSPGVVDVDEIFDTPPTITLGGIVSFYERLGKKLNQKGIIDSNLIKKYITVEPTKDVYIKLFDPEPGYIEVLITKQIAAVTKAFIETINSRPITFVIQNPGRQGSINCGSFKPVSTTENQWYGPFGIDL
jgi:hypothetical protein